MNPGVDESCPRTGCLCHNASSCVGSEREGRKFLLPSLKSELSYECGLCDRSVSFSWTLAHCTSFCGLFTRKVNINGVMGKSSRFLHVFRSYAFMLYPAVQRQTGVFVVFSSFVPQY